MVVNSSFMLGQVFGQFVCLPTRPACVPALLFLQVEDLARAEWLLIHQLDWRLRTPTACVFLHLFTCHLPQMTPKAFQTANYMLELSILDYSMLQYDYSTVAAAGLVAAFQLLGIELDVAALIVMAPFLCLSDIGSCADALLQQHLGSVAR